MLPKKSFPFIFCTLIILFVWAVSHFEPQGANSSARVAAAASELAKGREVSVASESYQWDNVAIGGGGYVTGLVIHPAEADLVYIRTDVGGAYRWLPDEQGWKPLTDGFGLGDQNFYGIDSLAVDPTVTDTVYIAAGKYPWGVPSDVLKSTDQGESWAETGLTLDMWGNGIGRQFGERLAVDPNQSDIIYFASRWDGLWRSTSAASYGSWQEVATFPVTGTADIGLTFVLFESNSRSHGLASQIIDVGAYGQGVYRSSDGGSSWQLLAGSPTGARQAELASDGTLYVSHDSGIMKFDGSWSEIAPTTEPYTGLSVDATNPSVLMGVTANATFRNKIYRSSDGGSNWSEIQYTQHGNVPWWPSFYSVPFGYWSAATSTLRIDPHETNRVWYTDWYGTWRTDDITSSPSAWYTYEAGHEELVTFIVQSLPSGANLLSGMADVDGFRHAELPQFPSARFDQPNLGDTTSIDYAASNPALVVRVGGRRWNSTGDGAYSSDNGVTWTKFPSLPVASAKNGRIAITATGNRILWLPEGETLYYSDDLGSSWTQATGLPSGVINNIWQWHQPLAADKVNENLVYFHYGAEFYRSEDGGATWTKIETLYAEGQALPNDWWYRFKAAPDMEGEIWLSADDQGLWRSSDGGDSFTQLTDVQGAHLFAFGKSAPQESNPTLFVYGEVSGIFRSDDMGTSWTQIDIPNPAIGDDPNTMVGDMQQYGRVYIGTNGRGIYVGERIEPLSVELADFSATQTGEHINVTWKTSRELDNLGFNLYRAEVTGTSEVPVTWTEQLNSTLIPSQAPGSGQGSTYEWVDNFMQTGRPFDVAKRTTRALRRGRLYYYWLEDVDVNGGRRIHRPVSVVVGVPSAVTLHSLRSPNPSLLWGLAALVLFGLSMIYSSSTPNEHPSD